MLLTRLANQEIFDFLKTVTIKNSYFVERYKRNSVNEQFRDILPIERNPYYLHLTGQYILENDVRFNKEGSDFLEVTDPSTGESKRQSYLASFNLVKSDGTHVSVKNKQVYTEGSFDQMMWVMSLDTKEEIPFTRENLYGTENNGAHKKTLNAYRVPGRYFDELCAKYPNQVDLIKSIVYLAPVKELSLAEQEAYNGKIPSDEKLRMLNVTEAGHLTLINYDDSILEERERDDLVTTLRATLDLIRQRWDVSEYTYEENYDSAHWAMLWSLLPLVLISRRYSNIKGPHVHSSHIWNYLTSHGLDSYRGYLSQNQEFFLYRNIEYIKRNRGQNRILNILVDNLLEEYALHIDSKTIVLDTEGITKETSNEQDFSRQCQSCARQPTCYKNIKDIRCDEYLGTKNLFKPNPVVLREMVEGAKKSAVIEQLMDRYDLTSSEATERYKRSFLWTDKEVEEIKEELNRNQVVDMNGIVEDLEAVVNREVKAGIEPELFDGEFDRQKDLVRHVRSNYLPTKLVEIAKDTVAPAYRLMFMRFVTDTIIHLLPHVNNEKFIRHVTESYKVDQDANTPAFIFGYEDLIAALYLSFVKEYDISIEGEPLTKIEEFKFPMPTKARVTSTFRFAKPIRQEYLIGSENRMIPDNLGNYILTTDKEPNLDTIYYIREFRDDGTSAYVLASEDGHIDKFDDGIDYFTFKPIQSLVTNSVDGCVIVPINGEYYAVLKTKTGGYEGIWIESEYAYVVLGKFYRDGSTFTYVENNDEIAIIPQFFYYNLLKSRIRSVKTLDDLNKIEDPKNGDLVIVWETSSVKTYDGTWRDLTTSELEKINQVTFTHRTTAEGEIVDEVKQITLYDIISLSSDASTVVKYEDVVDFIDNSKAALYERCPLANYINVGWIIDQWVDLHRTVDSQETIAKCIDTMFRIFMRLDIIRANSGDVHTQLAIKAFFNAVLVNKDIDFKLANIAENENPTFEDWLNENIEIGEGIRKIAASASEDYNPWSGFSIKLYNKLIEGCTLNYTIAETDKAKYDKLKMLIKSLSSYLINFIDTEDDVRMSAEIPSLVVDASCTELTFRSNVNMPNAWVTEHASIRNVDGDIYIPVEEMYAKKDVQYYMQDYMNLDGVSFIQAKKYYDYDKKQHTWKERDIREGDPLTDKPFYVKYNLREILGISEEQELTVFKEDGVWKYSVGDRVLVDGSVLTRESVKTEDQIPKTVYEHLLVTVEDTRNNYVWERIGERVVKIPLGNWNALIETFPNDPDVTIVKNAKLNMEFGSETNDLDNFEAKLYFKPTSKVVTYWGNPQESKELSEIMSRVTESWLIHDQSEADCDVSDVTSQEIE